MKRSRQQLRRQPRAPNEPPRTPETPRRTPMWALAAVSIVAAIAIVAGVDAVRTLLVKPAAPEFDLRGADPEVVLAIETAREEVNAAPESAQAWGHLGMVLMAHGRNADAVSCLSRAAQLDPVEPRWPYLAASAEEIDPAAAIAHLRVAIARDPSAIEPELLLAERLLQTGQLEDAQQHLKNVAKRAPDHSRLHLGLGRLFVETDRLDEARRHLQQSAASPFAQKASWELLAEVEHRSGNAKAARTAQAKAAELTPDPLWPDPYYEEVATLIKSREALLTRVDEYRRQGRHQDGRTLHNQLAREHPDLYYLALGRIQAEEGKLAEAEASFGKAAELAPESPEPWLELGKLHLKLKNTVKSADALRRVTNLEPAHAEAWLLRGRCARLLKEPEKARRFFETSLRYRPHDAAAHRELAELLAEADDAEAAEVHRGRAEQLESQTRSAAKPASGPSAPIP